MLEKRYSISYFYVVRLTFIIVYSIIKFISIHQTESMLSEYFKFLTT